MSEKETQTATDDSIKFDRRTAMKGGAAALGLLTLGGFGAGSAVAASGANKVYMADPSLAELSASVSNQGSNADVVTLASGVMKTSTNTDLIIQATAEVSLHTDIKTKGNDESTATAGVTCWVEIDGNPVSWGVDDDGRVVFNNREFGLKVSDFVEEEPMLELFLRTRSAHGFNWYAPDVGAGEHTIELKGQIESYVDGQGDAKALVGPRTLIVEPVNMSNDY